MLKRQKTSHPSEKSDSETSSAKKFTFDNSNWLRKTFQNLKDQKIRLEFREITKGVDHSKKPFEKAYYQQRILNGSTNSRSITQINEIKPECYEFHPTYEMTRMVQPQCELNLSFIPILTNHSFFITKRHAF